MTRRFLVNLLLVAAMAAANGAAITTWAESQIVQPVVPSGGWV